MQNANNIKAADVNHVATCIYMGAEDALDIARRNQNDDEEGWTYTVARCGQRYQIDLYDGDGIYVSTF